MKCPYCNGSGELVSPTIGALVRAARDKAGLTQAELAAKCIVSRPQIANIEADRSDVPIRTLTTIASALGISTKELVP